MKGVLTYTLDIVLTTLSKLPTEHSLDQDLKEAWKLRNSDATQAVKLAHHILKNASSLGYAKGIRHGKIVLAFAKFRLSDYSEALTLINDVLTNLDSREDLDAKQRALNIRGIIFAESGDLMAALQTFLETRELCQQVQDPIGEINALNNLALVYGYLGDFSSALDAHLRSLPLIHKAGFREGEMKAMINIAVLYNQQEQYTDALDYLQKSLSFRYSDDGHAYAAALVNFCRAYTGLGDFDNALDYGFESLALLEKLDDKATSAHALTQIGNVFLKKSDLANAETYFQKSLEIFITTGDSRGHAETMLLLAEIFLARQNLEEALKLTHEALKTSTEISAQNELVRAQELLAYIYKEQGNSDLAYDYLKRYIKSKEKSSSNASRQRFEALRIKFETEQTEKEKEIYRLRTVELAEANAKLEELSQELFKQANEDPLTGLFNRRRLGQELSHELERARRNNAKLSIMICDVDNFKQVNDRFSHQTGDDVLILVAKLLKDLVRTTDLIARYGGEEFVVLFPEASASEAEIICNRIKDSIANYSWRELHPELQITLSMGICDDISLTDGFAMLDHADDKLYEAKRNGKNQVRI